MRSLRENNHSAGVEISRVGLGLPRKYIAQRRKGAKNWLRSARLETQAGSAPLRSLRDMIHWAGLDKISRGLHMAGLSRSRAEAQRFSFALRVYR